MKLLSFCFIFVFSFCYSADKSSASEVFDDGAKIMNLSITFLEKLQKGAATDDVVAQYASLTLDQIRAEIDTENEKKAFWVNTYNAYVQHILTKDSTLFEDRGKFFSSKQITIAGLPMSLDDIEHGIIRANRWKLSWGYFAKPFPPKFIKKLKTKKPDGRVHLALNCGAKSCPAIAIYHSEEIDKEFDLVAAQYLTNTTKVDGKNITVTPLMSWFRGDFGNKRGIKKNYLLKYKIVDDISDVNINYGDYDWTLSLGNYIDL